MLNYQNLVCYGDSQTCGARTYTSWPHYLSLEMEKRDGKRWNVIERAVCGYTAKDLLKMVQMDNIPDCTQACVIIGTNDCKGKTNPDTFMEYLHRIIVALHTKKMTVYLASIPPIYIGGGDYPYTRESSKWQQELNKRIRKEFGSCINYKLEKKDYFDAVHFNDAGNRKVAKAFAEAICSV